VKKTPISAPDKEFIQTLRMAHPALSPEFNHLQDDTFHLFKRLHDIIDHDDSAYQDVLNNFLNPIGSTRSFDANTIEMAFYLNEATRYIQALIDLFPRRKANHLRSDPQICECNDFRELLRHVFANGSARQIHEARRKLYLAKLFFNVAHTRSIQMGEIHQEYFAREMDKLIFSRVVSDKDIDIAFNISADGTTIEYGTDRPLSHQEVWRFRLKEIDLKLNNHHVRLHNYFYSCRSKREVLPYKHRRGKQIYELRTIEKWTELSRRRDASIISKMLRNGITNPAEIPDILGTMVIVENLAEVEELKHAIIDRFGGPQKIHNITNTLANDGDRDNLNRFSGAGYQVFKCDLDVLFRPPGSDEAPYTFTVELQLYTLETYLRTIHADHYANHQALKKRQFLNGLAPLLFPEEIYHN
jgi:hypothetical protein